MVATVVIVWAVVATIFLVLNIREVKAQRVEMTRLKDRNFDLQVRADQADAAAEKTILAVAPLVEKTDWMTGRWGGQFNELVRMENARNDQIDKVRKAIMSAPAALEEARGLFPTITDAFDKENQSA